MEEKEGGLNDAVLVYLLWWVFCFLGVGVYEPVKKWLAHLETAEL